MEPAEETNKEKFSSLPKEEKEGSKEVVSAPVKKEVEKELFSWTGPARPFKRRNRRFYITLIAIASVVGLILFLVEGFMPVILIVSLVFLFYVLNTVEPENVEYKITNKGVKVGDRLTSWEQFIRYWFTKRFDSELLVIEMVTLPGRMELVVNPEDKKKIKEILSTYLVEEEASPSFLDKAAVWISKKMPQ